MVNPLLVLNTILGTALAAAGSMALNQYLERDVDRLMRRTAGRPLPARRLNENQALLFGTACLIAGLLLWRCAAARCVLFCAC